tara:strand:+ start:630 stop:1205 length:576 start_codon:yes stop_codon:yes gene_type:complete
MPLNVTIGTPEPEDKPPNLTVEFKGEEKETIEFQLKLRSALNGDLIILDHKDIDIVVQPENNKVVIFAKEILTDAVYGAESRLLEFLRKNGIIEYDSIQGGNVYGSLEGKIMESEEFDSIKSTVLNISEWMKTEQSYLQGTTAYEEMEDQALIDPDNAESTDLGQVDQAEKKGSIDPSTIFAPYLYGRFTY